MANAAIRAEALDTVKGLSDTELDNKIKYRGIDHKRDARVDAAIVDYEEFIPQVKEQLLEIAIAKQAPELFPRVKITREDTLIAKRTRMLEKLACCLKEKDFRKNSKVSRVYHDTDLYLDTVNGTDGGGGTVHDGLMEDNAGANYTALGATDATKIEVNTGTLDNNVDDDYNGDYLYNVTRGIGALITDYDADDLGAEPACIITVAIAGQTVGDTFYIIRACLTIEYLVETLVRTAGDRIFVRANQSEAVGATFSPDESGTYDELIEVIGCDAVTNDPWVDADNTLPDLDFGGAARQLYQSASYWRWCRIEFHNSTDSLINPYRHWHMVIDSCEIHDSAATGIEDATWGDLCVYDTSFYDNGFAHLDCDSAACGHFRGCTFNGGGAGTDYAFVLNVGGRYYMDNCTFGVTTNHNTATVRLYQGENLVFARNCAFDAGETLIVDGNRGHSHVFSEDHNQVYGDTYSWSRAGTITRSAAVQFKWRGFCPDAA